MLALNLLPPKERLALFRKIMLQALYTLVLFVVAWGVVGVAFLAQGWVFLRIYNGGLVSRLSVEQSTGTTQQTQIFEESAKQTNALLLYAASVSSLPQDDDAYLVQSVSSLVPPGVHLHSFSINSVSGTLTLGGSADTRDEFLAFRQRLEDQTNAFSAVESPLSNILSPDNVSFSLLLTLKR